jgi:hypothetical protein
MLILEIVAGILLALVIWKAATLAFEFLRGVFEYASIRKQFEELFRTQPPRTSGPSAGTTRRTRF